MIRVRSIIALALLAGAATPAVAKRPAVAVQPQPPLGRPSTAVTNEIVDAIAEEMDRALKALELPDAPKPYHISYKITEVEVNDAVASLGFITNAKERHFVNLECRVRVKYDGIDNGNFVVPGADGLDGVAGITLPLEATPRIARRAAWLVTDTAYKEALVQLRAKLDARTAGGVGASASTPWTPEKPVVGEDPVLVPVLEDLDAIKARAARLSKIFRGDEHVRDSRVAITSFLERRWYLSTEGTSVHDTRRVSGVTIVANGQAGDGQELAQYYSKYGHTAADLPDDAQLEAEARKVSADLKALTKAPLVARYSGPVLFEGEGAAGLVRYTLAPNLGGTPLPQGLRPQDAKLFGGALSDKVGLKVLAPFLSIVDDPTAPTSADVAVIGDYRIDDEGVPAQRVEVVKAGFLKSLLTSRTPSAPDQKSNGHARRTTKGGSFHGSATNLIVQAKGGLPAAALKKKLLAEARAQGLDHAIIIRRLDDSAITATSEMSRRELLQMLANADLELPPPSLLAYRVGLDGKETLVRGAQLGEVPIKAWKDILAAGNKPTVANFLASTDGYFDHKLGGVDEGFVPSSGIESSVTTPDLLFKELDVVPSTAGQRALPAIPAPATK
ncbi:MAG TPA: metallopeptidase TldD-related protein [Kofleriaceae bacterium]|nr:metallopeptidase TldD-related protein [Kofleriaceae bacterium]